MLNKERKFPGEEVVRTMYAAVLDLDVCLLTTLRKSLYVSLYGEFRVARVCILASRHT